MIDNTVKLLDANCYRNFKCWITDVGNVNPVFVASFKHPLESKPIDMYAKIYSLNGADRSIFNEIIGYLMAHALGLPQPKHACIALIPTDKLRQDILNGSLRPNLDQEVFQREVFPVFCTSKIDKSQTAFQYHNCVKAVASELAKWPDMGKAVAVDNTIGNTDRHTNNLLRTGINRYHLIDNGILINDQGWQISDLKPDKNFINKLLLISEKLMTSTQYRKIKGNAIVACNEHVSALHQIDAELRYWIGALYQHVQNDYNEFLYFVDQRANNAHGLLTSRLQMFI